MAWIRRYAINCTMALWKLPVERNVSRLGQRIYLAHEANPMRTKGRRWAIHNEVLPSRCDRSVIFC